MLQGLVPAAQALPTSVATMRILFLTGKCPTSAALPAFSPFQVFAGPNVTEAHDTGGRITGMRTLASQYNIRSLLARIPHDQQPDVLVAHLDPSAPHFPREVAAFKGPRVALISGTASGAWTLLNFAQYLHLEIFDRIVLTDCLHHHPIFEGLGLKGLFWNPSLLFAHDDAKVAAARTISAKSPVPQLASFASLSHPHVKASNALLAEARLSVCTKPNAKLGLLGSYAACALGLGISTNGELGLPLFEILASGTLLLADRISPLAGMADLWKDGREAVFQGGRDELLEKAIHFLKNPAEARALGRAGAAWFDAHCRQALRVQALCNIAFDGKGQDDFMISRPLRRLAIQGVSWPALTARYQEIQARQDVLQSSVVSCAPDVPKEVRDLLGGLPRVRVLVDKPSLAQAQLAAADFAPGAAEPLGVEDDEGRRRILFLSDDVRHGGTDYWMHSIALAAAAEGWAVSVAQPRGHSRLLPLLTTRGIKVVDFAASRFIDAGDVPTCTAATKLFQALRPELIVFCDATPLSNQGAKKMAHKLGIPYVVSVQRAWSNYAKKIPAVKGSVRSTLAGAIEVIAVSKAALAQTRTVYGLPAYRGKAVLTGAPAALSRPVFAEQRRQLRDRLGWAPEDVVVLCVGHAETDKGIGLMLASLRHLKKIDPASKLRFLWVGNGSAVKGFRKMVDELDLASRVSIIPGSDTIGDYFAAADIFVQPSLYEAASVTLLEAMANGLACCAVRMGANEEVLGEVGAYLSDPVKKPKEALLELLRFLAAMRDNADLRARLGKAARRRIHLGLTEARMQEEVMDCLRPLMQRIPFSALEQVAESTPEESTGTVESASIDENKDVVLESAITLEREVVAEAGDVQQPAESPKVVVAEVTQPVVKAAAPEVEFKLESEVIASPKSKKMPKSKAAKPAKAGASAAPKASASSKSGATVPAKAEAPAKGKAAAKAPTSAKAKAPAKSPVSKKEPKAAKSSEAPKAKAPAKAAKAAAPKAASAARGKETQPAKPTAPAKAKAVRKK